MNENDYPALYRAADSASANAQKYFYRSLGGYLALSIVGAALAVGGIDSVGISVAAAFVFLGGLAISIYMGTAKLEAKWYRARALAESVKTATWRFAMRSEPFGPGDTTDVARGELRRRLGEILAEHKDLANEFGGHLGEQDQITAKMVGLRESPLEIRIAAYMEGRVKEQRSWYARKSELNKKEASWWFWLFVGLQIAAVVVLILRIIVPDFRYWPPTLLAAAAAAALTWSQSKRFRELSTSYGLTAQEIGLAATDFQGCGNDEDFSRRVVDTENAFSREHTQWIARKSV